MALAVQTVERVSEWKEQVHIHSACIAWRLWWHTVASLEISRKWLSQQ